MRRSLVSALVCASFGMSALAHAIAAPDAEATVDWSSFNAVLNDLNPGDAIAPAIVWLGGQYSEIYAERFSGSPGAVFSSVLGWDTVLEGSDGPAAAGGNALQLRATVLGAMPGDVATAGTRRFGTFTLAPYTEVEFSAPASVVVNPGLQNDLLATVILQVYDASTGSGLNDLRSLQAAYNPFQGLGGSVLADSGVLTVRLANATDGEMSGEFFFGAGATATVPVPEPESYALMLAALGVLGLRWRASRGRPAA